MKTKQKRQWSDEQRQAAAERMRIRHAEKKGKEFRSEVAVAVEEERGVPVAEVFGDRMPDDLQYKVRPSEVQKVIDSMPEERKAKLAQIQARNMANLSQTQEGREALARMEARKHPNAIPQIQATQNVASSTEGSALSVDQSEKVMVEVDIPKPVVIQSPPIPKLTEVPMRVPFRLTGSQSGLMISELSSCVCGEAKLKWHPVCLRVKVYV